MRKVSVLVAVAALAGIGVSVFRFSASEATPFGGTGTRVVSANILSAPRLEASVSTEPGTYLGVAGDSSGSRLEVAVPTGVSVTNTPDVSITNIPTVALQNGTQVSLSTTSLDALTAATGKGDCTYKDGDPTATIGTTAANIPASPLASRTAITIWNYSAAVANALICSASGTATTTHGLRIEHSGQWWKWEGLGAGVTISCRCATGTCTYGVLEEKCYQ